MASPTKNDRIEFPENLPQFANNVTEPDLNSEQLNEIGFVAGDLPLKKDINYIGWHLTNWIASIFKSIGFNNNEIDSVVEDYDRKSDVTTDDDKNYPGTDPDNQDAIFPAMNDRLDMKISKMVDGISGTYQSVTEADWEGDAATFDTNLKKNANARINRKITSAFEDKGVSNLVRMTNYQNGLEIEFMTLGGVRIQAGGTYLRKATGSLDAIYTSRPNNLDFNILNPDRTGYDAFGSATGGISVIPNSISDRATVHVFLVDSDVAGTVSIPYADSDIGGANAIQHYLDNNEGVTSQSQIYIRRLFSTLVILRSDSTYQLMGLSQRGSLFIINNFCEPNVTQDADGRFLRVGLAASGGYNVAPEQQTLDVNSVYPSIPKSTKKGIIVPPRDINDAGGDVNVFIAYCEGAPLSENATARFVYMEEGERWSTRKFVHEHNSPVIVIDYSQSSDGSPDNNNWNWDAGQEWSYLPISFVDERRL